VTMEFLLNGKTFSLDEATVRTRVTPTPPHNIQTHWIEIDGRRWPSKQAFRLATGMHDEPFTTHFALRVFQRLGFSTSPIPGAEATSSAPPQRRAPVAPTHTEAEALEAFRRLDSFLSSGELTSVLSRLEAQLLGADRDSAVAVTQDSGFDADLVESALVVRERVGMLDTLLHAAVITQLLPLILEDGETVVRRPSLGAGNDRERVFDLETDRRVAEFKLSSWKGRDGMRQRGLFADVVGLSLDETGRRRQVYVVGDLPVRFLTTSRRNAAKTLTKAAIRVRTPAGLTEELTVSEFTHAAAIEVLDLRTFLPTLR